MLDSAAYLYTTPNTALAAWLHASGIEPLECRRSNDDSLPKAIFVYQPSPVLDLLLEQFHSGNAVGSILTFYDSYKKVLRLAHETMRKAGSNALYKE